jgi:hypothetical protein
VKTLTDRVVTKYAKRYGLAFQKLGQLGWTARTELKPRPQQIGLSVADEIVIFSIYPLVTLPDDKPRLALTEYLLLLNAETHLVKYGVDRNRNIQLTVQVAISALDYAQFAVALDAIRAAVEQHYTHIHELAFDTSSSSQY